MNLLHHVRRLLARFLWAHPALYRVVGWARARSNVFETSFDLLFDGFPRSGNTFGSLMLREAQGPRLLVIKAHTHLPPAIIRAIHQGKPVCLTLRKPEDAVISWLLYTGRPLGEVLEYYFDFHHVLLRYRRRVLVLPFEIITGDFPTVLRLLEMRFHFELSLSGDMATHVARVFSSIDLLWRKEPGASFENRVARPHPRREERKQELRRELDAPQYSELLQGCREFYQLYMDNFQNDLLELQRSNRATIAVPSAA